MGRQSEARREVMNSAARFRRERGLSGSFLGAGKWVAELLWRPEASVSRSTHNVYYGKFMLNWHLPENQSCRVRITSLNDGPQAEDVLTQRVARRRHQCGPVLAALVPIRDRVYASEIAR